MAWRDHETQVVGFDMVDTTKSLWPQAAKLGVANNIKFVRGNLCVYDFILALLQELIFKFSAQSEETSPFPKRIFRAC